MRERRRLLSVLVVINLVFAGAALVACAPEDEPTPSAVPSFAPTPSATPTALAPVVAFDGDCASVVDTERLSEAMGEPMNFREPAWPDGSEEGLGGVTCRFASDEYLSSFATVWVYPVEVIDGTYIGSDVAESCETYESTCVISGVFGDVWVGLSVYSTGAEQRIDGLRPILADIGDRADAQPVPQPGAREGWWAPTPTCEEVAGSLTDAGISASASGDRPAEEPTFSDGILERGCTIDVVLGDDSRPATFLLRSGAGDGLDAVLAKDPDARIEYEDRTFAAAGDQYPVDGGPGLLLGSDGVNLVELLRGHQADDTQIDAQLLDAILVAVER